MSSMNTLQLHELFQSKDLTELIRKVRPLLSNPLVLTDLAHNVLAMSEEPDLTDEKWIAITESGIIGTTSSVSDVYRRSLILHKPLLNRDIEDSIDVMRMAVAHREQLIGFLEIPCYNQIPDQEEQELIMFVADIACLIMKRDLGYLYAPSNERDYFIHDLIEGRLKDENSCRARCASLRIHILEHFRVMTIQGETERLSRRTLYEHKKNLERLFAANQIIVFLYGDLLKAIVPTKEDTALDGRFFDDLINYLKENHLNAGISKSVDRLTDLCICNIASEKAFLSGQRLKSDEIIFFYDKYSIYHLLENCDENTDPMHFCHSAIIRLADYDRTHNTNLLDTLRAFLYTGQNIAEASAMLYIHRNTMNNRLQKIGDLIHIDLQDSENIFHLMLSYHILEYVGAFKYFDYEDRISNNPLLKHQ